MQQWVQDHQTVIYWLTALSVLVFVGSIIAVPIIALGIPPDYFMHRRRPSTRRESRVPRLGLAIRILKNVVAAFLIAGGVMMLVLPGQGLLTIAMGLLLLDFPGKFWLERWFLSQDSVLQSLNWLRRRAGRSPIELPETKRPGSDDPVGQLTRNPQRQSPHKVIGG